MSQGPRMARLAKSQFLRFLATGGVAACVNLVARYLLDRALSFELAVALAFVFGMTTAYLLAKLFVFEPTGRSIASEFWRFAVVNAVALVLVWSISVGLARGLFPAIGFTWHANDIAHLIGVLAPAVTSYLGHRHFSFRQA